MIHIILVNFLTKTYNTIQIIEKFVHTLRSMIGEIFGDKTI